MQNCACRAKLGRLKTFLMSRYKACAVLHCLLHLLSLAGAQEAVGAWCIRQRKPDSP